MDEVTGLMFSNKDIINLLIKEKKLHEGLYELALEFQIMIGAVGPSAENVLPGVAMGVSRIGITKVQHAGINTIDAAVANPAATKLVKKVRKTA